MNKEFVSIGVNTDPMSVQLYFDETNSIKWKIVFSNTSNVISENKTQINDMNKEDMNHLITTLFPNIYIIGSKNTYPFLFNNINLSINDNDFIVTDMNIDYNNFDYYKYNQIIQENLTKNVSWKHYLKMLKNNENININIKTNLSI